MKKRFYQLGKQVLSLSVVIASTLLFSNQAFSQGVSINATGTGTAPDADAILDLDVSGLGATAKKGFLAPRVALANTTDVASFGGSINAGATSLLVYNTTNGSGLTPGFYYWTGSVWQPIGSGSGTITGSGTVNRVAKWTPSTTALGDGLFFDNGTTVGIGTTTPDASSILDLSNINNKGLFIPKVSFSGNNDNTTVPVTNASDISLLVYNTNTVTGANAVQPGFYYWNGTQWIEIASNLPNPSTGNGGYLAWDATLNTYVLSPMSFTGTVSSVNGEMIISGKIVQSSDSRFKKNVNPIEEALSKVLQMNGVTYNWRKEEFPSKNFPGGKSYGVIAQEIEKVVPELVKTGDDGYKSVEYSNMAALFIEAIKEQQAIIDAQKSDISVLKASLETEKTLRNEQLNKLISRISALENNVENTTNKAQK